MIQFKEREDEISWHELDAGVKWMVQAWEWFCRSHGAQGVLVTSVTSPASGRVSRTHEELRAADVRISDVGLPVAEEFADWLNGFVTMAGGMKPAIVGKYDPSGQHNDHLHLQVCRPYRKDRTIMLI